MALARLAQAARSSMSALTSCGIAEQTPVQQRLGAVRNSIEAVFLGILSVGFIYKRKRGALDCE